MQELKRFHYEINSHVVAGFIGHRKAIFHAGACFCRAGCGQHREPHGHGSGVAIHYMYFFCGASKRLTRLERRLHRA